MRRVDLRDERGAVLVLLAGFLPLALLMASFVLDLGNWWVHKRHLQTQADAAALAGAGAIKLPCQDAPIVELARQYSGDRTGDRNPQLGGTTPENVHMLVNSPTFYGQTEVEPDPPPSPSPCAARMVDVKMTETDLPWLMRAANLDFINATARVSIRQLDRMNGMLPVGVPDVNPKTAAAIFVDEATGAVLGSRPLVRGASADGLMYWDNAGDPLHLTVDAERIGVRIALSGGDSTTCGDPRVECYDAGSADGLVRIRGYADGPAVEAGQAPRVREVFMLPGSCGDGYFVSTTATCTIGVRARVDFALAATAAQVTAVVGGTSVPLTYDAVTGLWGSDAVPVAAAAGPRVIDLAWEQTNGTVGGETCKVGGGNKCKGTIANVHRVFSATPSRSGPLQLVQVADAGGPYANAVPRGSEHDFVVTIGLAGNLQIGEPGDPPVVLRVGGGGSQNQSVDCDPDLPQLKQELASGCGPDYRRNQGEACPDNVPTLWGSAEPWSCVAIQTGQAANQVPAGLNLRILGDEKPATCTSPNRWPDANGDGQPDYQPGDPRIVPVFLVPFGSFTGSGSGTVPVQEFAFFYVTGWTGQGGGFSNPCQGNGDDPVPGNDAAFIVGHFIKYVQNPNDGGFGEQPCDLDPNSLGGCVAVMTK
jgi:hypothetical protein